MSAIAEREPLVRRDSGARNGGSFRRLHVSPTGAQVITITIVAVVEFVLFAVFAAHFASLSNVYSMAQVSSYTLIPAVGLTFIFIAAEIDLSLGAILAFTGVIMALLFTNYGFNPWLAALLAVLSGAALGAVNGFVVAFVGVQSFIVTLGMLSILGGASLVITGGLPVDYPQNLHSSLFAVTNGTVNGFPVAVFWALGVFLVGAAALRLTKFGYHVYAAGGNRAAAREMGVRVKLVKFSCFVLIGALAGLAGVLETNYLQEADGGDNATFTLEVITAVIVGGVALYGGAGSMFGTLMGTAITGMLGNGLVLLGLNANWPELVEGIIIVAVVTLSLVLNRVRGRNVRGLWPARWLGRSPPSLPTVSQPLRDSAERGG